MSKTRIAAALGAATLLAGLGLNPILAQDTKDRTIEQYLCKDIMRDSGANRDVAIAFLHGFLLGKSGSSKFNLDAVHKQSDDFVEACLSRPDEKAVDAMAKIKK
jgi:hypothetical protein